MTELTAAQADALEILSESPAARTAAELARLLDESPYEIEDTLAWLKRHRFIVGVAAWQLTTGATYMLGSTHQLTDIELDVLHELSESGGVRTIDELVRQLGVAPEDLSETVHWLSANGYLQPVTAWRRKPVYY
ncbi:MarR family transcriptional regulator [Nocardia sp. BMG51109]|uniref:MarR family transcriptional regulator n=1 Tax=Nocardia sp. BMG51109 TaxID=1056816 RepID=UPI000465039B|nr:MarR family transcriptional regulator [Nocardia sp. BMG51109]